MRGRLPARPVVRAALLLFVGATCAFLVMKEVHRASVAKAGVTGAAVPPAATTLGSRVVVTYFHTTVRCFSCIRIEDTTTASISEAFAREIAEGRLEWRVVNTDEPSNSHFVGEYGLFTKSVIVSDQREGREVRWKNLDQVWLLLDDPAAFRAYVEREVRAFLESA
jgi:hypothetical protein